MLCVLRKPAILPFIAALGSFLFIAEEAQVQGWWGMWIIGTPFIVARRTGMPFSECVWFTVKESAKAGLVGTLLSIVVAVVLVSIGVPSGPAVAVVLAIWYGRFLHKLLTR